MLGNDLHRATRIKQRVENSLQRICSYAPFAVTRCEVSAGEFEFDYYSPEEKEVTLTLKAVIRDKRFILIYGAVGALQPILRVTEIDIHQV